MSSSHYTLATYILHYKNEFNITKYMQIQFENNTIILLCGFKNDELHTIERM